MSAPLAAGPSSANQTQNVRFSSYYSRSYDGGSSSVPIRSHSLYSVWERELTPRAAVSFRRLPWFGPSGASFIPAAPSPRRRVQRRSRLAVSPIVPLAPTLPGRVLTAASTTARLIGAGRSRGSFQQRPSDDMTAAPSNTVIGLTGTNTSGAGGLYPREACGRIALTPALDDDLSLSQRVEDLAIEQLVA